MKVTGDKKNPRTIRRRFNQDQDLMDVSVLRWGRTFSWIPRRDYLKQRSASLVDRGSFSFTYNPCVSCRDRWWSRMQCPNLTRRYPMKKACWRIPISSRLAHLDKESRWTTSPDNGEDDRLPMNSLARNKALCKPSYHSGNSFFSFKPPMMSFMTSSHSSWTRKKHRSLSQNRRGTFSTYLNRCCHHC